MMGKILSVYMANDSIRVCELMKVGSSVTVRKAFKVEIPSGAVDDGLIIDGDAVAQRLQEDFAANGIKRGKLAFVISSRKIASKEIVIPYMKNPNKVGEVIKANLDEYFPMNNLGDYVCRHTILDTFENAEGKHYSVSVMAVHKQMIEGYYSLAGLLKMQVETVDYYGNSLYQLLKKQLSQGIVLALQMDTNVTYVSIMSGQAQLFRRSVPFGRNTVIQNLASLKGITEEQARNILEDPSKVDTLLDAEEYGEIVRDFSSSITRVVEFHASRNPGTVIELCKLIGTGINIIGFSEILSKELGIEVISVKEINNIKIASKNMDGLNFEKIVDYLPNIGLCFDSLDLDSRDNDKKTLLSGYGIYYVLIIVLALTVTGVSVITILDYNKQKELKVTLEKEIQNVKQAEALYNEYTSVKNDFDVINNFYLDTLNNNEALYELIMKLEEVTPKSVGINSLTSTNGFLDMTCVAGGKEPVAAFVMELKKIPFISNVRVQNISDTYDESGQVTSTFNISLQIRLLDEENQKIEGEGVQE